MLEWGIACCGIAYNSIVYYNIVGRPQSHIVAHALNLLSSSLVILGMCLNFLCLILLKIIEVFFNNSKHKHFYAAPVLLPGKSHGQRSLVGCSPWGHKELDTTDRLHFHFSLSCIGEGNGNPLQCSCLENPRDGGAWWAAVYGVAQGQTRLK